MSVETIVAVYDTPAHAELAVNDLKQANVPADAISVHAAASTDDTVASGAPREQGFWKNLFGGEPDHDTAVYDRSIQGGSTVVTVKAPEQHVESVSRILESHSPIDINERAAAYGTVARTTTTRETYGSGPAQNVSAGTSGEDVIALSEEQIAVGKRLVDRGTTRVRRFVVETPVEQDVTLHSEHVSVQRRPVTEGTDAAAFADRLIEVKETDEEAVVGKTARVTEEVVVRKQATERVETIHDTVRREDVEIIKEPSSTGRTANTTAPAMPVTRPRT